VRIQRPRDFIAFFLFLAYACSLSEFAKVTAGKALYVLPHFRDTWPLIIEVVKVVQQNGAAPPVFYNGWNSE
jgi:hypothetical protein